MSAASSSVDVRRETVVLPTYEPHAPDRHPMFLEKRVYQGSSGRVYPIPFTDRVAERAEPRPWDAVFVENEYLLVMILPQLGGRIHRLLDKTNNYDAIYHQNVIKPALVGLAGPWISGGIELNWPQHHRPSTFMPADVHIERHADGAVTVWLSEHDPMARMKGMHGVRLHPGRAVLELVVRAYNRTTDVQTFLWWANVATRVHERYQSFFPLDATYVADHAKRAMSTFPLCNGRYYGVDYAGRAREGVPADELPRQFVPPHCRPKTARGRSAALPDYAPNDLSWYANIPVPTSYMCMGTQEDFFGGYDHAAQAGIVHVASHHISPGKKQWTWGNHEFGYAWDRNLTDPDANGVYWPYIELMAGVYTDNQPDFSFLQPGETKSWSQFWYPIQGIGPAHRANVDAAVHFQVNGRRVRVGVAVTARHARARIIVASDRDDLVSRIRDLAPDRPFFEEIQLRTRVPAARLSVRVISADGRELIRYSPIVPRPPTPELLGSVAAKEPPIPADVASVDELFLIGLHLEQYRHATRMPEAYWREALRRDPGDARCHLALGRWHLRRGEFKAAEEHLRASIARLTSRNPNPYDGESYYQLGRCLRHQALIERVRGAADRADALEDEAYALLYKATWNQAWQAAGFHALAEVDCTRGAWARALEHLDRALSVNAENLRARDLKAIVLRRLGRSAQADALLRETLALDPLDWWARHLSGERLACDTQVRLDLALDCARAGLFAEALDILVSADPEPRSGTAPMVHYYRAWLSRLLREKRAETNGITSAASRASREAQAERRHLIAAARAEPAYCFPARLEEIAILEFALAENLRDARAAFYLGNLFYDRRRHREAIALWQRAVKFEPANAVAWRNLGIGYFNIMQAPGRARAAYARAFAADPTDARLLFERDQLWKRIGISPARRLRELEKHPELVAQRDDLSIELCALYNQVGRPEPALNVLTSRRFQPWEGGEGQALAQHARTHLTLGRRALAADDANLAVAHFRAALLVPENLGEARHLLANASDVHYWLGCGLAALGVTNASAAGEARKHWTIAAGFEGDFQEMQVRAFPEMTYYSTLALARLGRRAAARRRLRDLLAYAQQLRRAPAQIDYFATSLPTMLLFDDDLQARQTTTALLIEAQARLGLGEMADARRLLRRVLQRDPSHALAAELLRDATNPLVQTFV